MLYVKFPRKQILRLQDFCGLLGSTLRNNVSVGRWKQRRQEGELNLWGRGFCLSAVVLQSYSPSRREAKPPNHQVDVAVLREAAQLPERQLLSVEGHSWRGTQLRAVKIRGSVLKGDLAFPSPSTVFVVLIKMSLLARKWLWPGPNATCYSIDEVIGHAHLSFSQVCEVAIVMPSLILPSEYLLFRTVTFLFNFLSLASNSNGCFSLQKRAKIMISVLTPWVRSIV